MPRLLAALLITVCLCSAHAVEWVPYIAADKSFSLHHPAGWTVSTDGGAIQVTDPVKGTQVLVIAVPFDAAKTPQALAEGFVEILKEGAPDIKATAYTEVGETPGATVYLSLTYSLEGKAHLSDALVVKSENQATWFSISGLAEGYSQEANLDLLGTLIATIAEGPDSAPPTQNEEPDPRTQSIEASARAFLFVLQFAIGTPLPLEDEKRVLAEVKQAWAALPDAELAKYDEYVGLVAIIRSASGEKLEALREQFDEAMREALAESEGEDPSISALRRALRSGDQILVPATTPLTVRIAQGYSELLAFARVPGADSKAGIDRISTEDVQAIRTGLVEAWEGYSEGDRALLATTPALWAVYRQLLQTGTPEDQAKVREQVLRLAPKGEAAAPGTPAGPMDPASHWVMLQVQQQTFNHWRWSRGYTRTMFGY